MNNILTIFAVIILTSAVSAEVIFKDCGSDIGKFHKVTVSNCDKSLSTCKLIVLTDATIELEFEMLPRNKVSNVTTVIHGNDILFPVENSNACSDRGISCPLTSNRIYKFKQTMPIKVYYPPIDV